MAYFEDFLHFLPILFGTLLVFQAYKMPYPNYCFYCTCKASRQVLAEKLPNHQLQTVAQYCGYDLENHHHALADAEACAQIAIKILNI